MLWVDSGTARFVSPRSERQYVQDVAERAYAIATLNSHPEEMIFLLRKRPAHFPEPAVPEAYSGLTKLLERFPASSKGVVEAIPLAASIASLKLP